MWLYTGLHLGEQSGEECPPRLSTPITRMHKLLQALVHLLYTWSQQTPIFAVSSPVGYRQHMSITSYSYITICCIVFTVL